MFPCPSFSANCTRRKKALLLTRCTKARSSKLRSCLGLASIRSSSRQSTSHLPHSIFRNLSVKRTRSNTSASNLMYSTLPSYRVAVRNLSNKNVRALLVHVLKGGQPQMSMLPQGKEGAPLIPIGNAYEFDARVATRATLTATGYAQVTLSGQVIEVSTAIFEDGSFEGDAEPALQYAANLQGDKIQLARVIGLFQTALDESQRD